MATAKEKEPITEEAFDNLTIKVEEKKPDYTGPYVSIFLPALESDGGMKVDQYEHVTISNELGEKRYRILRGEHVDVPVPVFIVLKDRYPKL